MFLTGQEMLALARSLPSPPPHSFPHPRPWSNFYLLLSLIPNHGGPGAEQDTSCSDGDTEAEKAGGLCRAQASLPCLGESEDGKWLGGTWDMPVPAIAHFSVLLSPAGRVTPLGHAE